MTQQQCSVLIIDDAYTVREYLRQTLLHLGISNIHEAANGKRGMQVFGEKQHDLVFLDIELPDINGQQQVQNFSLYRANHLLAQGLNDWSLNLGYKYSHRIQQIVMFL